MLLIVFFFLSLVLSDRFLVIRSVKFITRFVLWLISSTKLDENFVILLQVNSIEKLTLHFKKEGKGRQHA